MLDPKHDLSTLEWHRIRKDSLSDPKHGFLGVQDWIDNMRRRCWSYSLFGERWVRTYSDVELDPRDPRAEGV